MILGIGLDGGMAEEIVVPERCLVPLARGVSARDACLVEPLAIAIHGLRAIGLRAEDRVAVVGAGTIGLCAVAYAAGIAAEVGLHARHDAQAEVGERLAARPIEGEYDLVIECAGSASGIRRAVGLCRPGGRLLLLATYWGGLELPAFELALKEIRVTPSSLYAVQRDRRDIDLAAELLALRSELPGLLISHRYPLDAAAEAFRCRGRGLPGRERPQGRRDQGRARALIAVPLHGTRRSVACISGHSAGPRAREEKSAPAEAGALFVLQARTRTSRPDTGRKHWPQSGQRAASRPGGSFPGSRVRPHRLRAEAGSPARGRSGG
ncbi:MAG: zinc-binding dehydrogenase [Deltaproteobacteria bacterium]|nr:zinc-binding dehydrogenase [Deltaproteobacteria bacterium]